MRTEKAGQLFYTRYPAFSCSINLTEISHA